MPVSITKNSKSIADLTKMIHRGLGNTKILHIRELTEGFFNVAYLAELESGKSVIIKVAPAPETTIMSYEKNVMFSEVSSMKLVAEATDCPVAKILYYDDSHEICNSDYLIMEKLEGSSLSSLTDSLTDEEKDRIKYEAGYYNRMINSIGGEKFGYFSQRDKQGTNWFHVFKAMVMDGINDAKAMEVDLQVSEDLIIEALDKDKSYFDEITEARLVHWDIWDGNIFVHKGKISGIIDFERCLWGDILMEVGFRTYGHNKYFFDGYGMEDLNEEQGIRAKWYDVYFFVLTCLEYKYRQYDNQNNYYWGAERLKNAMSEIAERQNS